MEDKQEKNIIVTDIGGTNARMILQNISYVFFLVLY